MQDIITSNQIESYQPGVHFSTPDEALRMVERDILQEWEGDYDLEQIYDELVIFAGYHGTNPQWAIYDGEDFWDIVESCDTNN
ncbi:hypothetical protein CPHO_06985 [Corynebacterium phocae]|uniref:Uncharacterized protein n=1 Tax=Corynebacterium phocae TaxID=161895 RepID=A0A1L7D3F1_9CORY|nr:hypothetical protein [Corynebacterium phocae]APT92679.1 hypothetical protein CPHO_06985 [Corynebacterium phocae]KAA8723568.1 hypothetical protein F4V58_06500 [Corynebacterium phocae]